MKFAHISDIQVRLFKRHKEFVQSFENLYISLNEKKPDHIVLTGDLLHNKSAISAEQIDVFIDFLNNLVKISPIDLIVGNHDYVANNLSRMDSLSPIVKALKNPNIHYYKHSGIYPIDNNFNFVVFSCLDDDKSWSTKDQIDQNKINIGLYHGFVQGAVLQNGMLIEDCPYRLRDFLDRADFLLLGDIHKYQYLNVDKTAAYAGSLIQQNYGEDLEHGYLLWDIESKNKHSVEFVKLPNVCPYYTLALTDDLIVPNNLPYQQKARIRVFCRQLSVFEKKSLSDTINSLYNPYELIFMDDSNIHRQDVKVFSSSEKLENLDDLNVQERLLKEFLLSYSLPDDQMNRIYEINKLYNVKAREKDDIFRNVQYRLGKMEFHNMFSYGQANEFDFSQRKGVVGIFGKSAVGKSSLAVDVPLYTIFNRISKEGVVKNDLLINENKEDCASEIEIFVGRDKHVISRATHVYSKSGKREGEPVLQGKTEVSYKVYKEDGLEQDYTAEKRQDTDEVIRQKFGTIEDFISTSMAPQWQLLGIINAGATERLKLIGRYFDIDIFAQKHKIANDEWKAIKGQLKLYDDRNFDQELETARQSIEKIDKEMTAMEQENSKLVLKIEEHNELVGNLTKKIIPTGNYSSKTKQQLEDQIRQCKANIGTLRQKEEQIKTLVAEKNKYNIVELEEILLSWSRLVELQKKIQLLESGCACKHEDNCSLHVKINKLKEELSRFKGNFLLDEDEAEKRVKKYNSILIPESVVDKIALLEKNLENYVSDLNVYNSDIEQIEKNFAIQEEINETQDAKADIQAVINSTTQKLMNLSANRGAHASTVQEIEKSKKQYDGIKRDYDVYHYFLLAMSKDGIAKKIIADNLNLINAEIKKILSKGVGFDIEIESEEDGKAIEIYFKHEKNKKRKIELCSGMEKSISAIAIRAALVNITTLPRSNVMVLDEVFSHLDPEYLDAVSKMLEYLKQLFDSVIIITHLDVFKDLVDHVVEIERNDEGYSHICQ